LANAINEQPIGVTAEVQSNEAGQSSLVVTAVSTGEHNSFAIYDTDNSNAIAETGLDTVTREAQDALYTVDGAGRTASANTVELTPYVTARFEQVTPEEMTVTLDRDTQGIADAIGDMLHDFNALRQAAYENAPQDNNADALRRRMDDIAYDNAEALEAIGVTQENNQLQTDNEALYNAVENGTAQAVLSDPLGFGGQVSRLSEMLVNDPYHIDMQINLSVL
jgi:flagellar capping protein FliD